MRLNVKDKTVHSKSHSFLHDLKEPITDREVILRQNLRTAVNIFGYSIYWRQLDSGRNHMSIVENHNVQQTYSWATWFKNYFARRDAYNYLKNRWTAH